MRIDIMTLFPEMCERVLDESIIGRARKSGIIEIDTVNIRDFTHDKHNRVDDAPYGGGMGMLLAAPPIYNCYSAITSDAEKKPHTVYMSPQGKVLTQKRAAKEIGVCQKTLSAWESGKRSPRMNQLKIVCQVYGVPYDQIFLPS